jgi:hypothetical protein
MSRFSNANASPSKLSRIRRASRRLAFEDLEGRRVLAENVAPVNSVPGPQSFTDANPTVTFGVANQVSTMDQDAGSQNLRMTLFVNRGTITLPSTAGLTFVNGANGTRYLLFDGSQDAINDALLGMTYTPNAGTTSDVLTVDTHDLGHTGTGGAKVDRDMITISRSGSGSSPNQAPVNQVPLSQGFTSENRTITFGAFNRISTVDADAGNLPLRMTLFVNNGVINLSSTTGLTFRNGSANGTRYLLFDGSQSDINNALLNMTYTANVNATSDLLTVDTHDLGNTGTGGAKVDRDSITISRYQSAPNQAPVNTTPPGQLYSNANPTVQFDSLKPIRTDDPDAGDLPLRVTLFVNNGTITLGTTNGLTFRSGANGTRYLLFDGSQTDINNALYNMVYTANAGSNSDILTIDTHDLGHSGSGGAKVDRDTVTLTRVSTLARGGGGGSGESGSSTSSVQASAEQSTVANATATDSVFSGTALPMNNARIDTSSRLVDLLASSNSGRNKSPATADRFFEQA